MLKWPRPTRVLLTFVIALATLGGDALFGQGRAPANSRRIVVIDGHEAVEGEVIVRYRSEAGPIERERAEFQADSDTSERVGRQGARHLRSRRATTRQMLAALSANPDVEFAEPNFIIRANALPNDPSLDLLWGLVNTGQTVDGQQGVAGADIGADAAWNATTGSRANIVAILDTGIDFNHPDLAANVFTAPRQFQVTIDSVTLTCQPGSHGYNALNNSCAPFDDNGHGSHVAGIIGAVGNNGVGVTGVNWTATLMPLKILAHDGTGTTTDAIKAIEFAIQAKSALGADGNVRVLNASWGGGAHSQTLEAAIQSANNADMLFVAAAGSEGHNNDVTPHYPASFPGSNIVSVTAVDNTGRAASFSNYGATSVDLAAPGASTFSTFPNNQYGYLGGTSMSAPFVSGAAALVLSACPSNTATLKSTLLSSVDPDSTLAGRTVSGGRLNVGAAIQQCLPNGHFLSIGDVNVSEGNSGTSVATFTVTMSPVNPTQTVTVNYSTANGSASAGTDYAANSGTLTFAPSAASRTVSVTITGDMLFEPNETFVVDLSNPTNALISDGQATGTILNDDSAATVTVSSTTVAPGGTMTFTVANGPANRGDWLALYCPTSNNDVAYYDWKYLSNSRTAPAAGLASATVTMMAPSAAGTTCHARLFANDSYTKLATSATVTVTVPTQPTPTLTMEPAAVAPDGTLTISLANGPANAGDWVALYCPSSNADVGAARLEVSEQQPDRAGGGPGIGDGDHDGAVDGGHDVQRAIVCQRHVLEARDQRNGHGHGNAHIDDRTR